MNTDDLGKYARLDCDEVVVISTHCSEESGGYQAENFSEELAIRKGSDYWKISTHERICPMNGSTFSITNKESITQIEFDELRSERTCIDVTDLRAIRREKARLIELEKASAPKCPKCRKEMVKRRSNGGEFWGCQDFFRSGCRGRRKIEQA